MTLSEELFERLCKNRQVSFKRVPTADGQRTADYKIWLGDLETIVEVKQIEVGKHEHELLSSAGNKTAPPVITDIQSRIRNKFDKAKEQLKNLSGGRTPAMLVLYDNTDGLSGIDNEAFMNAMHGDEVVQITLGKSGKKLETIGVFHTYTKKRRKVGRKHNRTVSALGRLLIDKTGNPILFLFHNEYSTNRLYTDSAALLASKQFLRPPAEKNEYRSWQEVTSSRSPAS